MSQNSHTTARRRNAVESFATAAQALGDVGAGMAVFALNRGQWSMIDAMLYVLDAVGPADVSVWTWSIADYEVQVLSRLAIDRRIGKGLLVVDHSARNKSAASIHGWKARFGPDSVRYVVNHSKMSRIETKGGLRFLLRGSMNLNCNARFEQFDITEGGPDHDLVKRVESELPVLSDDCSGASVYAASKVSAAFDAQGLEVFNGVKAWTK